MAHHGRLNFSQEGNDKKKQQQLKHSYTQPTIIKGNFYSFIF